MAYNRIVITVLKTGGEFIENHVHALFRNLGRSLSVPFTFLTLTNSQDLPTSMVLPLRHDWSGWWSKLELFRPNLFHEEDRVVYMDLDTVLFGNVDWLFDFNSEFVVANGPMMILKGFRKPRWASGLMAWRGIPAACLAYDEFARNSKEIMSRYELGGDQAFMMDFLKEKIKWQYWEAQFDEKKIASYKRQVKKSKSQLPMRDTVVCFHGHPRPWDVPDDWVKEARA